jgi:TPR repeat protein
VSKTEAFRKLALTISIAALIWMAFIGLYAPALLMVGMVWLIALVILSLIERRLDQMSLVPLWVGEYTAKTPDDFVELAEGFRRRGQIFGNQAKTQAYYLKAAESGNTKAQARLGEAFYFGHYGRTNREEGIRWLKVAASTGDQHALHVLRSIESN